MVDERVQRRLAAILAADVAGYSRLMGVGEVIRSVALRPVRLWLRQQERQRMHLAVTSKGFTIPFVGIRL